MQSVVNLEWTPAQCNGSPLTSYRLELSRTEAGPFDRVCDELVNATTVTGLQSGMLYWFRVQAINQVSSSVAVLAEILLRSPRKIIIFIIKKEVYWVKVSKKYIV